MTGIEVEFFFGVRQKETILPPAKAVLTSVSLDTDDAGIQLRENCSRFFTWKSRRYD